MSIFPDTGHAPSDPPAGLGRIVRMEIAATTRRRWFRFSLRTLFVAVTVVASWLGYQLNWIMQRKGYLQEVTQRAKAIEGNFMPILTARESWEAERACAPGLLWLFGEKGVRVLYVPISMDGLVRGQTIAANHPDATKAKQLFPEAEASFYTFDSVEHTGSQVIVLPDDP